MTAYYNEFDKHAAAWLRELIAENLIAPGVVDERSIEDVTPGDLAGFTQCHFFAGIGGWSAALRLAGVSDSTRVWTGSPPCQPFSEAGKGGGFADERHLWPAFHHLIRVRRPPVVLGEQSASKYANSWFDLVQADMEALAFGFGAVAFPSAGIGAPHLRDRGYWVAADSLANAAGPGLQGCAAGGDPRSGREGRAAERDRAIGQLAHANVLRLQPLAGGRLHDDQPHAQPWGGAGQLADAHHDGHHRPQGFAAIAGGDWKDEWLSAGDRAAGILADATRGGRPEGSPPRSADQPEGYGLAYRSELDDGLPGPANGYWRAADWLGCRDGKWRPVEPGTQPLADGLSGRVGALRGFGNAVNVYAAKIFIEAFKDHLKGI